MTSKLSRWQKAVNDAPAEVLSPTTKHILLSLSMFMDENCRCYPSQETQAEKTGYSVRAISVHLAKAVEAGFLTRGLHKGGGRGRDWARSAYRGQLPRGDQGHDRRSGKTPRGHDPDDSEVMIDDHTNLIPELSRKETAAADAALVYDGHVIRLNRRDWEKRKRQYGLSDRQLSKWMNGRDDWLAKLPKDDRRVVNWWTATWKALEADLDGIRISARYARQPRAAPPAERPAVVVWG